MSEYLAAVREVRVTLEGAGKAAEAGLVDDIGFIVADAELDVSLAKLRQAQQAYGRHRKEAHS